jgi:hypothetical protein
MDALLIGQFPVGRDAGRQPAQQQHLLHKHADGHGDLTEPGLANLGREDIDKFMEPLFEANVKRLAGNLTGGEQFFFWWRKVRVQLQFLLLFLPPGQGLARDLELASRLRQVAGVCHQRRQGTSLVPIGVVAPAALLRRSPSCGHGSPAPAPYSNMASAP